MAEQPESREENGPRIPVALTVFVVLAALEWIWGRWVALLFPPSINGILSVTASARLLDGLLLVAMARSPYLKWRQIGFQKETWKRGVRLGVAWSLVLGGAAATALVVIHLACGRLPRLFPADSVWFRLPWPGMGYLLVAVMLSPFVEELVFRGLLYGALRKRFSVWVVVILTATLFAAVHGISPARIVPAVFGGALCALSFEHSRSLWTPIVIHVSGNGFLWGYGLWWAHILK
ncbi:MAG: CPBP family intramembrane metalloprotease [Deltaproteobacteria bacterium]|nr:CPBP family intramembrane metalloprotease [Deltaproteobacteria bacterium]